MLEAIIHGNDDPKALAELARRRLRGKIPQLRQALYGHVTEHHRFMLRTLYGHLQYLEGVIAGLDDRIKQLAQSEALNAAPRENGPLPC